MNAEKCDGCGKTETLYPYKTYKLCTTCCQEQRELDTKKEAWDLAQRIENFVNGGDRYAFECFAQGTLRMHRTLQQSFFGLMLTCCQEWAKSLEQGNFDGRNEWTCESAKKVLAALDFRPTDRVPLI